MPRSSLRALRRMLRDRFFRLLRRAVTHDEGRDSIYESASGLFRGSSRPPGAVDDSESPYDTGGPDPSPRTCEREDIIILTGRFRSGSTLLWNLFRHVDGVTAYYEPFNERRWFDPGRRGDRMDGTHRGVEDYWREYAGLDPATLPFRGDWARRNLYMDAESWDPAMKRYVEMLVESARGRPVLKFNRIDFRLPWFRHTFPRARFIHIVRHPRDQWCSSLGDPDRFGPDGGDLADFAPHDAFYLLRWVRELGYAFPFLRDDQSAHPYRYFYWLWKLSYLFGRKYADVSIRFEDLVEDPRSALSETVDLLGLGSVDWDRLCAIVEPPELAKWRNYAAADWFAAHEAACEDVLRDFLRDRSTTQRSGSLRDPSTASSVAPRWRMLRR